jgi:glycine/D-amino acid oxidase-like deaminating enzyme
MLNISLPLAASPALFIRYKAQADMVNGVISSPAMEVRQGADGTLLAAEDYVSDAPEHQPMAIALQTAKAIQHELGAITAIEPEAACIGLRPMPEDGVPIVGYLPGIGGAYVCVMHPGVTLAATVGRLVSEEIVDGVLAAALVPCRPQRVLEKSTSV